MDKFSREDLSRSNHLMPFSMNVFIVRGATPLNLNAHYKHPVMSLNSHTIPTSPLLTCCTAATETLINQSECMNNKSNLHFCDWPLRMKAFRLWWRTFDLTNCTRTLYHHFDSSWHVPFTKVDRSGVWIRIELMCPVICSASATSITSDMLMLACGIVSGCKWLIFHYDNIEYRWKLSAISRINLPR